MFIHMQQTSSFFTVVDFSNTAFVKYYSYNSSFLSQVLCIRMYVSVKFHINVSSYTVMDPVTANKLSFVEHNNIPPICSSNIFRNTIFSNGNVRSSWYYCQYQYILCMINPLVVIFFTDIHDQQFCKKLTFTNYLSEILALNII